MQGAGGVEECLEFCSHFVHSGGSHESENHANPVIALDRGVEQSGSSLGS
jgi:hypothetical protein